MVDEHMAVRLAQARANWSNRGTERPSFAIEPSAGQESVWDYPRPPAIVADSREVVVAFHGEVLARTSRALKIIETASPPTFYLPREDVKKTALRRAPGTSICEWKGNATYFDLVTGSRVVAQAAWSYDAPFADFAPISKYVSFYPARVECWVAGERVRPQPGGFYGGWITDEVVGPFKGEPGTQGW